VKSRRDANIEGAKAAARLHQNLEIRRQVEAQASSIDVFGTIIKEKIPLVFKPLDGLLGAYLPKPTPGIMVTTKRSLSVQRFTGAHELGHAEMDHRASLDDEAIIQRAESPNGEYDPLEAAANAFASDFLLPAWLLIVHAERHRWTRRDLATAPVAYQLALGAGASFEATCLALLRHNSRGCCRPDCRVGCWANRPFCGPGHGAVSSAACGSRDPDQAQRSRGSQSRASRGGTRP